MKGLIALLFASFILLISVTSDPPIPQNTIYCRMIAIDSVRMISTRRAHDLAIHAGSEQFQLSGTLFPAMPRDSLMARLLRADQVEIWLTTLHERRLLGLRAPGLDIPPSV